MPGSSLWASLPENVAGELLPESCEADRPLTWSFLLQNTRSAESLVLFCFLNNYQGMIGKVT